ncbi:hypothetical protein LWP59_33840 [Amycolatopsis acidiphila]|uniref:Helix-turn-helix domain-containing protein n=1 Tax=Amycolatopsis acidiphila TaxID=715473 RepID=A0A558A8X5_9PSEU|nr:hypothetical protein [Amycolatopsis acidiphila]TVT20703.1 hypothetical protein FNH06_19500 [Amycolatopsis acidiphila]UIJ59004.1 hypothetical protein LWP59_33840 [Amycolatopsis acidiphila]
MIMSALYIDPTTSANVRLVEALANPSRPARRLLEMATAWPDSLPEVAPPATVYRIQRQLRPDEVAQMVAQYRAGATMQDLADRFDVHRTTILKRLQTLGITTRFSKLEPDEVREAAELYRSGWTLDNLAKKYRVASSTVRAYFLADGVALRPRGRAGFQQTGKRETTDR